MKKRIITVMMALVFALSVVGTGMAAGKSKCTIDAIDGDKVTMTCKKADKLKVGTRVRVKELKAAGDVEGC